MIPWFHSHYFIWNNSKSLDINATNQLTPCYSARHISINSPGGGAKNFYVAQKASDSKWCWHTLVPKNRHSLRKKNISRVGVDQMHCPNSMLVGGLGLKSYQRENSECFDLFFGLRENRVVATVLKTVFSTTNCSFKHIFTKCD